MSTLLLVIDCGNTRLKWGSFDAQRLLESGALPLIELGMLTRRLPQPLPPRVVVSNVAGERAAVEVRAAIEGHGRRIHWAKSQREQCGVYNGYLNFKQLGADRWAALIGARHLHPGPSLVVMAGTATTADVLDAEGRFQGGLILPGFELMRTSLTHNTAQLRVDLGQFSDLPRNTDDAVFSGCLQAQLGAVERMFAHVARTPGALCLISGGGADVLAGRLAIPTRVEQHLVLQGLACIAATL